MCLVLIHRTAFGVTRLRLGGHTEAVGSHATGLPGFADFFAAVR